MVFLKWLFLRMRKKIPEKRSTTNKNSEKGNTVSQNMIICKEQQRMLCFGSAVH